MLRRTKIIATPGPVTDDDSVIEKMIRAGINLVRITFSHGKLCDHRNRVNAIRKYATALGRQTGILVDLQGPKIRIAQFKKGPVILEPVAEFVLDASLPAAAGTPGTAGLDYKELSKEGFLSQLTVIFIQNGR